MIPALILAALATLLCAYLAVRLVEARDDETVRYFDSKRLGVVR